MNASTKSAMRLIIFPLDALCMDLLSSRQGRNDMIEHLNYFMFKYRAEIGKKRKRGNIRNGAWR